jgi:hypothetical protein
LGGVSLTKIPLDQTLKDLLENFDVDKLKEIEKLNQRIKEIKRENDKAKTKVGKLLRRDSIDKLKREEIEVQIAQELKDMGYSPMK